MAGYSYYSGTSNDPYNQPYGGPTPGNDSARGITYGQTSSGLAGIPAPAPIPGQNQPAVAPPVSNYFAPSHTPQELLQMGKPLAEASASLGGGYIRNQDIGLLNQEGMNKANPFFQNSQLASGDLQQYAQLFQQAGFDPSDTSGIGEYLKNLNLQHGALAGAQYGFDPNTNAVTGNLGGYSFNLGTAPMGQAVDQGHRTGSKLNPFGDTYYRPATANANPYAGFANSSDALSRLLASNPTLGTTGAPNYAGGLLPSQYGLGSFYGY